MRLDQRIKPAAKTAAGDFLGREPLRPEQGCVHQVPALIVGDEAHAQSLIGKASGQPGDRSGFPGAQEAANHDVAGLVPHAGRGPGSGIRCFQGIQIVFQPQKIILAPPLVETERAAA